MEKSPSGFTEQYSIHLDNLALKIIEYYFLVQLALSSAVVTLYIYDKIKLITIPFVISFIFGWLIFFSLADLEYRKLFIWRDITKKTPLTCWYYQDINFFNIMILFISVINSGLSFVSISFLNDLLHITTYLTLIIVLLVQILVVIAWKIIANSHKKNFIKYEKEVIKSLIENFEKTYIRLRDKTSTSGTSLNSLRKYLLELEVQPKKNKIKINNTNTLITKLTLTNKLFKTCENVRNKLQKVENSKNSNTEDVLAITEPFIKDFELIDKLFEDENTKS